MILVPNGQTKFDLLRFGHTATSFSKTSQFTPLAQLSQWRDGMQCIDFQVDENTHQLVCCELQSFFLQYFSNTEISFNSGSLEEVNQRLWMDSVSNWVHRWLLLQSTSVTRYVFVAVGLACFLCSSAFVYNTSFLKIS
jgi:hypothetical protein